MQPGFFIQQSASKGLQGVRFTHIRQLNRGAHWRTPHMLSCLLIQTIGSSKIYFRVFLSRHLHIRCAHWGIPYISFVDIGCCGIKCMIFHE